MFAIVIVSVSIFHSEYSEWNNHQDTIKIYETWSFVTDPAREMSLQNTLGESHRGV